MAYLPFVPQITDDSSIASGDEVTAEVNITVNFPFGDTYFSTLYVSPIINIILLTL